MKNKLNIVLFFLGVLFLITNVSGAQIFSDGFESGGLAGWSLSCNDGANNWTVSTTDPFFESYHAQSKPQDTLPVPASVIQKIIGTSGYQNINIAYYRKLIEFDSGDEFTVKWFDGSVWTIIEQNTTGGSDGTYVFKNFNLSNQADNNANFALKFECTAGAVSEFCRVDDINITGTIIDTTPPSITITYPQNIFYNINVSNLNYTFIETNPSYCWYSLDLGITNSSVQICGANWTGLISSQGSNTWRIYANDTNGNLNWSDVAFFKDTIKPNINIIYPLNNTNTTNNQISINYTIFDNFNLGSCWWTNDSGLTNHSIICGNNITGQTWNEGINNIKIYINDSVNNINSSSVIFLVDRTGPLINIAYPETKIYGYNTSLNLNFTTIDSTGVSSCWYNINNGNNITIANCQNTTFNASGNGSYVIYLYANDSLGNIGFANKSFSISTTLAVSLEKPLDNQWLNYNNIELNYSVNTASQVYNCSLFGNFDSNWKLNQTNSTAINSSGGINKFFLNLSDGVYIWNVRCFAGVYDGFALNNYTLNIDTQNPVLNISYPLNNSLFRQNISIELNYSVLDANLQKCWYSLDNGITNRTLNCLSGFNNLSFGYLNESYNLTVYANDSAGNMALFTIYNITIEYDFIAPNLIISEPSGTKTSQTGILLQYFVNDNVDLLNELTCGYNVYRGASPEISNTSINCSINSINFDVSGDAFYILNFYVKDRSGNLNISNSNFSVSTPITPPSSEGGNTGGGGGGGSSSSNLTIIVKGKMEISRIENFVARAGDKKTLSLKVKNNGKNFLNNCRLIGNGQTSSWIYSSKIQGIAPGENANFIFNINIPEEIDSGDYNGIIEIICDEASSSNSITINIPKTLSSLTIKEIKQNKNKLNINYLLESNDIKDINIEIWIVDKDKNEIEKIKDDFKSQKGINERNIVMTLPEDAVGIYSIYFAISPDLEKFIKQSLVIGQTSTTGLAVLDTSKGKIFTLIIFVLMLLTGLFLIIKENIKSKKEKIMHIDNKLINKRVDFNLRDANINNNSKLNKSF